MSEFTWIPVTQEIAGDFAPTVSVFREYIDQMNWEMTKPGGLFYHLLTDPGHREEFDRRLEEWEALDWERTQRLIREGRKSYGPHLWQCMPLEIDPENLWYWLPEEDQECECL